MCSLQTFIVLSLNHNNPLVLTIISSLSNNVSKVQTTVNLQSSLCPVMSWEQIQGLHSSIICPHISLSSILATALLVYLTESHDN
jgi:hypothetical protein